MVICPKCKEEIVVLNWSENAVRFGIFGRDGYAIDSVESNGNDEYACPKCEEVLFKSDKEAREFLNG
jgi:predicted RNA-binding Zn-ribbon protein involved in translation (DUF1610 family)